MPERAHDSGRRAADADGPTSRTKSTGATSRRRARGPISESLGVVDDHDPLDSNCFVLDYRHLRALLSRRVTRASRPLSQVGHPRSRSGEIGRALGRLLSLRSREPVGFAGEATLASSGVVENAAQKTLAGHCSRVGDGRNRSGAACVQRLRRMSPGYGSHRRYHRPRDPVSSLPSATGMSCCLVAQPPGGSVTTPRRRVATRGSSRHEPGRVDRAPTSSSAFRFAAVRSATGSAGRRSSSCSPGSRSTSARDTARLLVGSTLAAAAGNTVAMVIPWRDWLGTRRGRFLLDLWCGGLIAFVALLVVDGGSTFALLLFLAVPFIAVVQIGWRRGFWLAVSAGTCSVVAALIPLSAGATAMRLALVAAAVGVTLVLVRAIRRETAAHTRAAARAELERTLATGGEPPDQERPADGGRPAPARPPGRRATGRRSTRRRRASGRSRRVHRLLTETPRIASTAPRSCAASPQARPCR